MICPYCDSRVRQVPDNRCCPNCGGPLGACVAEEIPETRAFPEPPLGIYSGNNCWLEIGKDSVRIRQEKVAFFQTTDYEIGYDELTGVVFQSAEGESFGYLCLRCRLNQNTPFPADWSDGSSDPTTVLFKKGANAAFSKVYAFLEQCVDIANNGVQQKHQEIYNRFPIPPVGIYKGVYGTMEITEEAVCFVKTFPLTQKTEYRVPYKELVTVHLTASTLWVNGKLSVRCWQNRHMEFTNTDSDDEVSICFSRNYNGEFRKVYEFLKECAKIANEARCEREEGA